MRKVAFSLVVSSLVLFPVLGLAQVGQEYIVPEATTLEVVAQEMFGDPAYAPAIMAATNRRHIEDPTFARIGALDVPVQAGWKLLIPDREWADGFLSVWTPAKVELLFGTPPGGQLVVASWWTAGGEAEGLNALFDIYREYYPDVEIVNATIAGGAGYVFRAVIKPRLLAGDPPDTFQLHAGLEVEGYSPEVYLEALDDLYTIEGWTEVFPADVLELLTYQGHYWGVPVNIHRSNVLWYSKTLFGRYGLTPPGTWDEFFQICERLAAEGIAPFVMGNSGGWEAAHTFETVLAGVLGAEGYRGLWTGETPWSDPRVTEALEIFARMLDYVNPDYSAMSWDGALQYFLADKGAMHIMGDWAAGWFMAQDYDFGWAPVPGTRGTFVALSDTFCLPKRARNRDNAIAWLRVAGSKEGQIAFNMRKGSIPARTDLTQEEKAQFNPYLQSAMDDWARDAIVPSLIHGAAAIESWVTDFKDAINLFLVTKDVAGTQAALIAAAADALAAMAQ